MKNIFLIGIRRTSGNGYLYSPIPSVLRLMTAHVVSTVTSMLM